MSFLTHEMLREVSDDLRTCQFSITPIGDGRCELSLLSCDHEGQVLTDLSGTVAPDDLELLLRVLPLELVTMGSWARPLFPSPLELPGNLTERRKKHPNLYAKWTDEDDERLRELHGTGSSVADLADDLGRSHGGVTARLVKLGLLPPEQGQWAMRGPKPTAQ
jgi:hypothetical protein